MTIEEHVYARLCADAGVTALVRSDHIRPPGDWQSMERPYIAHLPVAPRTIQLHNGGGSLAPLTNWASYQVSVFADSYSGARAIAKTVIACLEGQHSGVNFHWTGQETQYEADVRVVHVALLFDCWEAL